MELNIYEIILGPAVTEKAYKLNRDLKQLVLRIHPAANKTMVKEALWKLFNVKVEKIGISNRKKSKKVGRRIIDGVLRKKAIVTLAEGYTLDLFGQAGSESGVTVQAAGTEKKD